MHDVAAQLLHEYWRRSGWNASGSYLHLTSTSASLLDFPLPHSLGLSISASPSAPFFTTYRLRALPTLDGQIGYLFARTQQQLRLGDSRDVDLARTAQCFRIVDAPRAPPPETARPRDYLLYGSMHVPSLRVDALYTLRYSPCTALLLSALSHPAKPSPLLLHERAPSSSSSGAADTPPAPAADAKAGKLGLQLTLQRDTGRWFTEYSYSVDEALWGLRVLHNFGVPDAASPHSSSAPAAAAANEESDLPASPAASAAPEEPQPQQQQHVGRIRRIGDDEDRGDDVGASWQGRFSAGAEMFFSAREKSAGISTGLRFSTLPERERDRERCRSCSSSSSSSSSSADAIATHDEQQQQPPTTITATLNPMMGHLSTAYASRMTKDLVACSRYDFNVYSYESELTLGAEYWLRAAAAANKTRHASDEAGGEESTSTSSASSSTTPRDVVSADASRSTASLREARFDASASASTSSSAGAAARRTASLREWAASEEASEERRAAAHLTLRDAASPLPRCDATLVAAAAASASSLTSSSPASASVRAAASSSDGSSKCDAAAAPLLGILKARLSSSGVLALLWEGRLHSTLVSFGLRADVSAAALRQQANAGAYAGGGYGGGGARKAPLRGIGLDLQYFSTSAEAEGEMERRRSRWSAQGEEHAI